MTEKITHFAIWDATWGPDDDEDGWTDEDIAWNEVLWIRLDDEREEEDAENA